MDFESYYRFVLALGFVLGLIWLASWAVKRFGVERNLTGPGGAKGKRLAIVEVQPLDARRKLVLLRRDKVEHLVILGNNQELVVEAGIAPCGEGTGAAARQANQAVAGDIAGPGNLRIPAGLEAWRKRTVS